ncbi:MAG: hypothetical protein FJ387_26095 [Verrucomicrobia bacterium]|nr:hypothetical protein [Verrucomicrobiota bacterium]
MKTDETNPRDWFLLAQERLKAADAVREACGAGGSAVELLQEAAERYLKGWVFDPFDPRDIVRCLLACSRARRSAEGVQGTEIHALTSVATELGAMGEESREILKAHTPPKAAEAIYRACGIAIEHRRRKNG